MTNQHPFLNNTAAKLFFVNGMMLPAADALVIAKAEGDAGFCKELRRFMRKHGIAAK